MPPGETGGTRGRGAGEPRPGPIRGEGEGDGLPPFSPDAGILIWGDMGVLTPGLIMGEPMPAFPPGMGPSGTLVASW